ncbi:MAG: hypothetical protein KatS3mg043_1657 [Rhodothermaceae bacterium]|nr:MAG: hypothetical protein KatS3mg043_1657 [Rhodothermaceae bacterium]
MKPELHPAWRLLAVLLLLGPDVAAAQGDHGFRFVRIRYEDVRGEGRRFGGAAWAHDYPTAELNFYEALNRTTRIYVEGPPLVLTLDDPRLFEYPVLYLCEPGYWEMTDEQAARLRQYLDRGGFILFDDFRGEYEWINLVRQMKRVYPDRDFIELPPEHPVWRIYFDIDPVEAPSLVSGGFSKYEDRYLALFDDEGRMVALANRNQDIGDGWEWPEQNFDQASTISFQMGINFVMYALTH